MIESTINGAEEKISLLRRVIYHPLTRIFLEVVLFYGVLFGLKVTLIKPGLGLLGLDETVFRAWQGVLTFALMFAVYAALMRIYEKRRLKELAFKHFVYDSLTGTFMGAGLVSIVFAVLYLAGAWHIVSTNGFSVMIVPVIWITLLATMEELVFRGILYRTLEEWLGTIGALLISAFIFGGLHIFNDNANLISVLSASSGGLLMGALYSLTGRLWIPIFFHITWNLTQAIFGSVISGSDIYGTFFESVREGPEWLTGGPFGIENSLVAFILMFSTLVVVFIQMKQKNLLRARVGRE